MREGSEIATEQTNSRGSGLRKLSRWALIIAALLLAMILVLLLVLRTPWGTELARRATVGAVNRYVLDEGRLTIAAMRGSIFGHIEATDLRLSQHDNDVLVIDTLRARYRLFPLLSRRVSIELVEIVQANASIWQRPDSTWNVSTLLPASSRAEDEPAAPWTVALDTVRLGSTSAEIRTVTAFPDTLLHLAIPVARLYDLQFGGATRGRVDSLRGRVSYPSRSDPLRFGLSGLLDAARLRLDTLFVTSPDSDIRGHGRLPLAASAPDTADFDLTIRRLAFHDLRPFVTGLDSAGSVNGRLSVLGDADSLSLQANLNSSDGGALAVTSTSVPSNDSGRHLYVDGDFARINPGFLTGNPQLQAALGGHFSVEHDGHSFAEGDGRARIDVLPGTWRSRQIEGATLRADLRSGGLEASLTARAFDAALELLAEGRPFDDRPTYTITGSLTDLTLPLVADTTAGTITLHAPSLHLHGQGYDVYDAAVEATIDLSGSRYGACVFDDLDLTGTLAQGQFESALAATVAGSGLEASSSHGGLELRLTGSYAEQRLDYELTRGSFNALDLGCAFDGGPSSDLTGELRLSGSGTALEALRIDGSLAVGPSTIGPIALDTLILEPRLRSGRLDLTGFAQRNEGQVRLSASGQVLPSYTDIRAQVEIVSLNMATVVPEAPWVTDLNATVDAAIGTTDGSMQSASITVDLVQSHVNDQAIDRGSLSATFDGSALRFDGSLQDSDLAVDLRGEGTLAQASSRIRVDTLQVRGLDLSAVLPRPSISTNLNIAGEAVLETTSSGAATGRGRLTLQQSKINRATIRNATTSFTLDEGTARLETTATFDRGSLFAAALAETNSPQPHYEILARFSEVDLYGLVRSDSLRSKVSGALTVSGDQVEDRFDAAGLLAIGSSSVASVTVDTLIADATYANATLHIDTLLARTNAGRVTASGPIALGQASATESALALEISSEDLAPLASLLPGSVIQGRGGLSARLSGPYGRLRATVEPSIDYLIYDAYRLSDINGRLVGEQPFATQWEVDLQTGFLSNPYLPVRSADIEIDGGDGSADVSVGVVIDGRRSLDVEARLETAPDDQPRLVFQDVSLTLGRDVWTLLQEAPVTLTNPYRVRSLLLSSGNQQLAIDGFIDLEGSQNLVFTTEGLRVAAVADLLGYQGLDGTLNTFLVLTGPASEPEVSGGFRIDDITSQGEQVGSLDTQIEYADGRMNLEAILRAGEGEEFRADGFIPLNLSLTGVSEGAATLPIELTLATDGFPIGWVEPFLDPALISAIDGRLETDVQVSGTQGEPHLSGTASVTRGAILLPATDTPYRDIDIQARLEDRRIIVERANLEAGNGTASATGSIEFVTLTLQQYDLDIETSDFRAIHDRTYQAAVSGTLRLAGDSDAPVLTGDIALGPMDVYLTDELTAEELEPVKLTARDLQILESRFGYLVTAEDTATFDFYQALSMDLEVEMERDVWLRSARNPEMNIEFTGSLEVSKEPYQDPRMFGVITVNPRRSVIRQYGRRFGVESGTLRFNGPFEEMVLDFRAAYRVQGRRGESGPTIYLDIDGRLDNLEIQPSSDPPMETIDIVSYIATGRPAAEGLFGGSSSIEQQAAGVALGQLSTLVEGVAGEELGLDVIEIEYDGLRGATLTLGKYVYLGDQQVFVSLRQPVTLSQSEDTARITRNTEAAVEFQAFQWMLVRLVSQSRSLRFTLLYEYAY